MKDKKVFVIAVFFSCMLLVFHLSEQGRASVPLRNCETCHTIYPEMTEKGDYKKILLPPCVSCHANTTEDTIKILGEFRDPSVYNTYKPKSLLAGGSFYYVSNYGDRKGHNIDKIANVDAKFLGLPPGYDRALDPSVIGYNKNKPLTCAGSNGCHGNRNIEEPFTAMRGAHHGIDFPVDGTTIARSYRYLSITHGVKDSKVNGVVGLKDNNWGQNSTPSKHNEYSLSMNRLCVSCHGNFHGRAQQKAGFRHPVGAAIPYKGEFKGYITYNLDAPVGRENVPEVSGEAVSHGSDVVICLSCHMAHGSPYNSSLRWNFDIISAGSKKGEEERGGCFICHTKK
ncbi:MAG: cytochrome c3 family protein [Nitrospirota bacterium]|nr:cytochrome c3 family protein [Nitrospirota bacterium]